ncbi:hypothetical protein OPQ81_010279 [Rhizoctonia solani]|nr:hypothetical protein OPQ81_010279 [Rhizoctonia solani]
MSKIPPGIYRLEPVNRDSSPTGLYATYQGAGEPITTIPSGPKQTWEFTPAEDGDGYNVRAVEVNENFEESFLRNEYLNSTVSLGTRTFLRITQRQGSDAYTISGPYRAGTYGAADWIGVKDKRLVMRTMHEPEQTDLEYYLWNIERA